MIQHLINICVYPAAHAIKPGQIGREPFAIDDKVIIELESNERIKVELKEIKARSGSVPLGIGVVLEGSTDSAKKDDCVSFDLRF